MYNTHNLPECHTCIWFQHIIRAIGRCHLNPPIPIKPSNSNWEQSELPITWETNYCSHHRLSPQTEKQNGNKS